MSAVRFACLTPSGSGAIATLVLSGPCSWEIARRLFHPASSQPLPELPPDGGSWFGTFGDGAGDEVILAVPSTQPEPSLEIHCHGGRQVVRWLTELLRREGCAETGANELRWGEGTERSPWALLPHAKTLRTAAILLDQANGAFERALKAIRIALEQGQDADAEAGLEALLRYAPIGQHLLEPWRIVIAGAPNAGKSSLFNALAGYQRSVVAPVPGTTRDVVTATLAFDGWLVELSDTAGLREVRDDIERQGVERARLHLAEADLCIWVFDTSTPAPQDLAPAWELPPKRILPVLNKTDLPPAWNAARYPQAVPISALTGSGLDTLVRRMIDLVVPDPPPPGAAVPYSREICTRIESLRELVKSNRRDEVLARLQDFFE